MKSSKIFRNIPRRPSAIKSDTLEKRRFSKRGMVRRAKIAHGDFPSILFCYIHIARGRNFLYTL